MTNRYHQRTQKNLTDTNRMTDFGLQWASHDGGDEYILPEFGIQPTTYYRRLLTLLQSENAPQLTPTDRQKLVTTCLRKLGLPAMPGTPVP